MRAGRATGCHYCPAWVTGVWLCLGLLTLILAVGCNAPSRPASSEASANRQSSRGLLTGVVRGPRGAFPMAGRHLDIVETQTGTRHTAQTGSNGAFTIQLPSGRYRIDVPLHEGETLVTRPGLIDLGQDDADSHVELVLGPVRASRPRGPAYRLDNGLGSPIT